MKTQEELKQIKKEYTELNNKLAELSEDELTQVTGGSRGLEPLGDLAMTDMRSSNSLV